MNTTHEPTELPPSDARTHLAWLMWCFQQGYVTAEDRAGMTNWVVLPDEELSLDDVITKENLLAMADEVLLALDRGLWSVFARRDH